jgi:N-methylhydantoinase A
VTDANLVLGYLSAERPLGGSVRLDPARARAAIDEHVGAPLGLDTAEAAIAIHRIVNANMTNGIRFVSVARGRDPRDYALFAFGGAAATHASIQARELGIGTILVPRTAGVLSALGALLADLRVSAQRAFVRAADAVDLLELNTLLSNAWEERRSAVQASDVLHIEPRVSVDMRYDGQVHELTVPVAQSNGAVSTFDWDAAIAEFHDIHEQLYTFRMHDKPVQVTTLRLELVGVREKPDWQSGSRRPAGHTHASTGVRTVLLPLSDGSYAPAEATVYDGSKIEPGQAFQGPAIVEEESTTLVLHDGDRASLDESGIYQIAVGDAQ